VRITNDKEEQTVEAERVIIATGSRPTPLPGVEYDGDRIGTSTEALSYPEVPGRLVVIGAGYIGLEMGSVWRRLSSEVTVLEYLDRALPGMDEELGQQAQQAFEKQGLNFRFGTKVTAARAEKGRCVVEIEGEEPIECDRVLTAVGRLPNTEGLNVKAAGIELDEKGRVPVGDRFETSATGVYAIGDVIEGPMLAHKAMEEGVACVEGVALGYGHVHYNAIPAVVYTHPEIASVGRTEQELREAGIEYRKGTFPFAANGRARTLNDTQGQVKMLADAKTDRVLGVHIIGPRAGDMIAEAAVAVDYGASGEDIGRSPHAHPTLAESLKEAALAVDGRPLHI
jgi:dihydrolipoamide dehydrogenase